MDAPPDLKFTLSALRMMLLLLDGSEPRPMAPPIDKPVPPMPVTRMLPLTAERLRLPASMAL